MIDESKKLCGYYNYTVVLTYLGMLMGFVGMTLMLDGSYRQAVLCLMAAGICDMFDGTVAATKQRDAMEKRFGIQIDSLSDLVCFGMFPALFAYLINGKSYIGLLVSGFYLLCALIRLAYFNVLEEERQCQETGGRKFYLGLPVTSVALILPAVYAAGSGSSVFPVSILWILLLTAAAFLLPFRIKMPYLAGKIGIVFTGLVEFVILLLGLGLEV